MKSIIRKLMLVCISVILCGCNASTMNEQISMKTELQTKDMQNNEYSDEEISKLSDEDFKVYKDDISIELGMEYKNFETDEEELSVNNTLLTSKTVGDYYYKYFLHEYKTFDIVTSNQGYVEKGDDFDTYYIVNIVLKDTAYSTNRGIKVGATKEEVLSKYGTEKSSSFGQDIEYTLNDKWVSFSLNKDDIVEGIILSILIDEEDDMMQEQKLGEKINESEDNQISQEKDMITDNNEIIYTNKKAGFTVALPKSWNGKYKIDEWEEGVQLIHLIDQREGDILFSVSIYGTVEEWNETGDYPYTYIGERGGLVYVVSCPSESNYEYDTEEGKRYIQDYKQMWEDLGNVEDRVQLIEDNIMNLHK